MKELKSWEEVNYQLQHSGGVNPHAFRLGWLQAKSSPKEEVERSEEVKKEPNISIKINNPLPFIMGNLHSHVDRILRDKGMMHKEIAEAIMSYTYDPFLNQFLASKDSQSEIESLRERLKEQQFLHLEKNKLIKELESKLAASQEVIESLKKDYEWFKIEAFKKSSEIKKLENENEILHKVIDNKTEVLKCLSELDAKIPIHVEARLKVLGDQYEELQKQYAQLDGKLSPKEEEQ
jgi:hypothetical protein